MLLATLLSSTAAAVLFYRVLRALDLVASPVWTAVLFCFLPPRWLIYHAVGATEPLFYCFLFGALLCDARRKSWGVILCVVGASWTRITGVLLVPAFALVYAERRAWRDLAVLPVAGAGTLALLTFHALRFGDFFAYLRWQGGTGHLVDAVPLAAYRDLAASPSFHATELFFFLYVVLAVGTFVLWKCREVFAVCAVFFVFDLFQYNSDLSRILLPTFPFALLVAFDPVLTRREARFALPLVVILAYVYAWGFLPHNLMPEEGYARLLAILGSP
jgi:hypothetical protein